MALGLRSIRETTTAGFRELTRRWTSNDGSGGRSSADPPSFSRPAPIAISREVGLLPRSEVHEFNDDRNAPRGLTRWRTGRRDVRCGGDNERSPLRKRNRLPQPVPP